MADEKKRVTIAFEGEPLEWINQQIEERMFHNYQHAVEYCILQTYKREFNRFDHVNVFEDHATIFDNLRDEFVNVYFQEEPYCEKCEKKECIHIKYALTQPKIVEPLREKGWTIVNGRVIKNPG